MRRSWRRPFGEGLRVFAAEFFGVRQRPLEFRADGGVAEVIKDELVSFGDRVGPVGADAEAVEVANHQQRRIFQRRGRIAEAAEGGVQVFALAFVFPAETAALPDVRPALAPGGFRRATLEGISFRVASFGEGSPSMAQRSLKWDCAAWRSVPICAAPFVDEFLAAHSRCDYQGFRRRRAESQLTKKSRSCHVLSVPAQVVVPVKLIARTAPTKLTAALFNALATAVVVAAGLLRAVSGHGVRNFESKARTDLFRRGDCDLRRLGRDPTCDRIGYSQEAGRMTPLQIYSLLAPLLVVGFALIIVALTRWLDRRDERRRAEGKPARWGIDYL